MIDKIKILDKANTLGSKKTIKDLDDILDKLNTDKLIKEKKDKFKSEIWDKKKSINGITAKKILASKTYEIDQVYLIYIDDKLVYMQDHNPTMSGFVKMTKEDINEISENFIQEKATQMAYEEIYNTVITEMLK